MHEHYFQNIKTWSMPVAFSASDAKGGSQTLLRAMMTQNGAGMDAVTPQPADVSQGHAYCICQASLLTQIHLLELTVSKNDIPSHSSLNLFVNYDKTSPASCTL